MVERDAQGTLHLRTREEMGLSPVGRAVGSDAAGCYLVQPGCKINSSGALYCPLPYTKCPGTGGKGGPPAAVDARSLEQA